MSHDPSPDRMAPNARCLSPFQGPRRPIPNAWCQGAKSFVSEIQEALRPTVRVLVLFIAALSCPAVWAQASADAGQRGPGEALVACLLEPGELVAAGSPVPGVLARVARERGDPVRKGDVLFELESSVERATLELARTRVDFARAKLDRNGLLIREKVLSESEIEELRQEVRLAEAAAAEAGAVLERRRVVATLDGVVLERLATAGEYVRDTPVLRIATLDPLKAEITLRATWHGRLRAGQTLRLSVEGQPSLLAGRVLNVDPHIDAASGTFTARLRVANPGARIPPGLTCRLTS